MKGRPNLTGPFSLRNSLVQTLCNGAEERLDVVKCGPRGTVEERLFRAAKTNCEFNAL